MRNMLNLFVGCVKTKNSRWSLTFFWRFLTGKWTAFHWDVRASDCRGRESLVNPFWKKDDRDGLASGSTADGNGQGRSREAPCVVRVSSQVNLGHSPSRFLSFGRCQWPARPVRMKRKRRRETVNVLIDSFLGWRTLMTFTNQSAAAGGGSQKMIISCKTRNWEHVMAAGKENKWNKRESVRIFGFVATAAVGQQNFRQLCDAERTLNSFSLSEICGEIGHTIQKWCITDEGRWLGDVNTAVNSIPDLRAEGKEGRNDLPAFLSVLISLRNGRRHRLLPVWRHELLLFFLFVRSLPGSYDGERYIYRDSLRRFLIGLLRLGLVHGGSVNGIEDKHLPCSPRMDCLCVSVCTSV